MLTHYFDLLLELAFLFDCSNLLGGKKIDCEHDGFYVAESWLVAPSTHTAAASVNSVFNAQVMERSRCSVFSLLLSDM